MQNKYFAFLYLIIGYAITGTYALADVIKTDDLIVQGNQCVGFDCRDGINFQANTLVLRENNLRIRFHDTSAPDVLGQSWNLSANSSANGGTSYFQFELKSLIKDNVRLSDGTAPLYDCSIPVASPSDFTLVPTNGVISFGEPILTPQNAVSDGMGMWIYECLTTDWWTEKPILSLGTAADSTVTLGFDSRPEPGTVSIGNTGLLRNLKHVAAGIADMDILIKGTMDNYSTLPAQKIQAELLEAQLAVLEAQISAIEDEVFADNSSGSGGFSPYFILWLIIGGGLVRLIRHHRNSRPIEI